MAHTTVLGRRVHAGGAMRYGLNKKMSGLGEKEIPAPGDCLIEILNMESYKRKYGDTGPGRLLLRSLEHVHFCKGEMQKDCVLGTFSIPQKEKLLEKPVSFGYYMDKEKLLFVDESGFVAHIVKSMVEIRFQEQSYAAHFLFEFMERLLEDDVRFLQAYELKMTDMEDGLFREEIKDCPARMLAVRRELLRMNTYYDQMVDFCEMLEENYTGFLGEEDCRLFRVMGKRIQRLADNTRNLREYTLQIREMYQARTAERQNKIMQFLTVVTTIFMPLTLITGWYGMNFINMPELHYKGGYFIIIGVVILIVIIEILYFKHKKWFD
ncbi:hypothetical protein ADH70_010155 [Blautia pseudococcoides]|uniref:Magnesium transporter n=2 Tax=Blautia pseudococcoides TaxID=1796616 RepID=A0A1C7IDU4_9FIRM|nr:hypothetical protein A4V09_11690 [Blautia pseudococcoides]ASU29180.1 hypothetical protein ADH70_010155 [Blautia pseudococcoides]